VSQERLVNNVRQTPLTKNKIDELKSKIADLDNPTLTGQTLINFHRNRTLVDFDCIPENISINIVNEYEKQKDVTKLSLHQYFFKHGLKTLYGKK
jgi:hypothetical protein